jgi:hypothetical protein
VRPSVGKTLANGTFRQARHALRIVNAKRRAVVVTEIELGEITCQVRLADMVINANNAALENGEVAFYGVRGADFRAFPVIYPHMASTKSQRKATRAHRSRAAARGLVHVEVQTPKRDAPLIRAVAQTLRGRAREANALRTALGKTLAHPKAKTAFDVFGSDLPDETFDVIFDQPRHGDWRKLDL